MKSTAQIGMFSAIPKPFSRPGSVRLKRYMKIVTWAETASISRDPRTTATGLDASAVRTAEGGGGGGPARATPDGRRSGVRAGPRAEAPLRRDNMAEASLARIGKVAIAASVTARLYRRLTR